MNISSTSAFTTFPTQTAPSPRGSKSDVPQIPIGYSVTAPAHNELVGRLGHELATLLKLRSIPDVPSDDLIKTVTLFHKIEKLKIYSEFEFNQFQILANRFSPTLQFNLAQEIKEEFPQKALPLFESAIKANIRGALGEFTNLYCLHTEPKAGGSTTYTNVEKYLELAAHLSNPSSEVLYRYGEILFDREIKNMRPAFGKPVFNSLYYFAAAAEKGHLMAHFMCIVIDATKNKHPQSARIVGEAYQKGQFTETALPGFTIKIPQDMNKATHYLTIARNADLTIARNAKGQEEDIALLPNDTLMQRIFHWYKNNVPADEFKAYNDL